MGLAPSSNKSIFGKVVPLEETKIKFMSINYQRRAQETLISRVFRAYALGKLSTKGDGDNKRMIGQLSGVTVF